jgi:hypothetical protein
LLYTITSRAMYKLDLIYTGEKSPLFDDLDQIHLPDPVMQDIENLKQENARLKKRLAHLENSVNESRSSYDDN